MGSNKMSTSATLRIYDENNQNLVVLYKHFDGYPSGFGYDLYRFLKDMRIVNGIPESRYSLSFAANGMGCLAAQIVAQFKDCIGDLYIVSKPIEDVEYEYFLFFEDNELILSVYNNDHEIYSGPIDHNYLTWIKCYE